MNSSEEYTYELDQESEQPKSPSIEDNFAQYTYEEETHSLDQESEQPKSPSIEDNFTDYTYEEETHSLDLDQESEQHISISIEDNEILRLLLIDLLPEKSLYRKITYRNGAVYEGECRQVNRPILPKRRFQKHDEFDQRPQHPLENNQVVVALEGEMGENLEHDIKKMAFILHGRGEYDFVNGDRFEGSWVANRTHGNGLHFHKSGTTIEGRWTLGRLDADISPVEIRYFNGDTYVGKLDNASGLYEGDGTFVHRNNTRLVGDWHNGTFVKGTKSTTIGYEISGTFVNGIAEGNEMVQMFSGSTIRTRTRRTCSLRSNINGDEEEEKRGGFLYRGSMWNGFRHGFGKIEWTDNTEYEGEFWLNSPTMAWPEETKDSQQPPGSGIVLHRTTHVTAVGSTCITTALPDKRFCYLLSRSNWNRNNLAEVTSTYNGTETRHQSNNLL
jgi:hypothetical protein